MKKEYYTDKVTLLEDGTYRWYYDVDMYQNKSMLYTGEKLNLSVTLAISVGGALLVRLVEDDASFAKGVMLIGLGLGALSALLIVFIYYIIAQVRQGNYRIHFLMREEGISYTSGKGSGTERKVLAAGDPTVGYRGNGGRPPSAVNLASNLLFPEVFRCKSSPRWNMIEIYRPGGKFKVYVRSEDFEFVEQYIMDRIPKRARRRRSGVRGGRHIC